MEPVTQPDFLGLPLARFLDEVAAPTPAPGAGAVAATAVALGAALTAMSAGLSRRHLARADHLVEEAEGLQQRVRPLGEQDAAAYQEVLAARGRAHDDPERDRAVQEALSRATDIPLEIAEIGVAVMELAADVVRHGNPSLRGDAATGCLVARAGVEAATMLVALNLDDPEDPRRRRAAELSRVAQETSDDLDGPAPTPQ